MNASTPSWCGSGCAMTSATTKITDLSAEGLADVLPYVATGLRVALETRDIAGKGAEWAAMLAEIASRSEAQFLVWKKERQDKR